MGSMKGKVVKMWKNWKLSQKTAFRIVLIYILIGVLWIFFSDYLLKNSLLQMVEWIAIVKGCIFIFISGVLFYYLIRKEIGGIISEENKYRLILENVSDLIAILDIYGNVKYVSPSIQTITGYTSEEVEGASVFEFVYNEDIAEMQGRLNNRGFQQDIGKFQINIKHKDGHLVLVEGKGTPIINETGNVEQIAYLAHDITDKKLAENKLLESEERYKKFVEFSPETTLIHINGEIVYVNKAGLELIGAEHIDQIIGKNVLEFVAQDYLEFAIKQMKRVEEGITEISEYEIVRLDGTCIYVEILSFKTTYDGEQAAQVIVRDISERKRAEEKVKFLAYYDTLSGLPNRNLLYDHLGKMIKCNTENHQIVVMFFNLNRFKRINDALGHSYGDLLLKQVSAKLNQCVGDHGILFRYGGDEYVLVLENIKLNKVSHLADKFSKLLASPFYIQERPMFISTSIGISVYPKDGDNVDALIKNAHSAMYFAKENGKDNYQYYSPSLDDNNIRKLEIENGIRKAIENTEFTLHYQPQVDLFTNEIVGLEALIRWKHPEYGYVSPSEFISIAEETGLIVSIGEWVLKTACKQFKQWQVRGFPLQSIAVNVSALQFRSKKFIKTVHRVLQETGLDPCYLELEITESITQQVKDATKIMNDIKSLGVNLSVDDFGTGYSSLNYLRHFPIDKLKIDKSFVDEINNHSNGKEIVKTIIELGNRLDFKVIAEGVENEHQLTFLKENNCQFGQGYLFSKPLQTKELEAILREKIGL